MEQDVFICHSSDDLEPSVRGIYDFLKKNGVECFCASITEEEGIPPGGDWMIVVERILKKSRYFIYVVSNKSLNSSQIKTELQEAHHRQKDITIIPYITEKDIKWPDCLEENILFDGIRMYLRNKQSIETNGEPLSNRHLMRLAKAIGREIIEDETAEEKKYKTKLREFLSDGQIVDSERNKLEAFAEAFKISLERANQLEQIVKQELGFVWPEVGIDFLRNLYDKLQNEPFLSELDFYEDQEFVKLRWFFTKKNGLGIRLIRWGKGIRVRFGMFSENAKIDPEFKRIADNLKKQNILKGFDFYPNKKLRVSYNKFVEPKILDQHEFQTEIYNGFVDFCMKIKPLLNLSATDDNESPAIVDDSLRDGQVDQETTFDPDGAEGVAYELLDKPQINNWLEFEETQGRNPRKKPLLRLAKSIHDLLITTLKKNELPSDVHYGNGTFSISVPREKAKYGKRTCARFGLLGLRGYSYLESIYKKADDPLPEGAKYYRKNDPDLTKYEFPLKSEAAVTEMEKAISGAVLKSYKFLSKNKEGDENDGQSVEDDPNEPEDEKNTKISYANWTEFEKEQGKDPQRKPLLPLAKMVHDLLITALNENKLSFVPHYGGGTFSISVPKDIAQSGKRVCALFGLLGLGGYPWLKNIYKEAADPLPKDAACYTKNGAAIPTKYYISFKSEADVQEMEATIKDAILKSYKFLSIT